MAGRVVSITIGWTVDIDDSPSTSVISLDSMRQHCRPERVEDLLEDLQLLCEDVQDARDAANRGKLRVLR